MENKETFTYTYNASEQEEINKIRQKYEPQPEDKMEQLRRLDASVTKKAVKYSITIGVIGTLVLGFGMSLILSDLYLVFGFTPFLRMVIGIAIGIVGIGLICAAYPLYHYVLKKERKRIAPEIIRLTDELLK